MSERSAVVRSAASAAALVTCTAGFAFAQFECSVPGPDGVVGAVHGGGNFPVSGGIDAFSLGAQTCNVGAGTMSVDAGSPSHPILTTNLYRLKTADGVMRFEQIGMSW